MVVIVIECNSLYKNYRSYHDVRQAHSDVFADAVEGILLVRYVACISGTSCWNLAAITVRTYSCGFKMQTLQPLWQSVNNIQCVNRLRNTHCQGQHQRSECWSWRMQNGKRSLTWVIIIHSLALRQVTITYSLKLCPWAHITIHKKKIYLPWNWWMWWGSTAASTNRPILIKTSSNWRGDRSKCSSCRQKKLAYPQRQQRAHYKYILTQSKIPTSSWQIYQGPMIFLRKKHQPRRQLSVHTHKTTQTICYSTTII